MITIDLDNYIVPLGRAGKFGKLDVSTDFPAHVQVHIYQYGLRQILNDAMAVPRKDAEGKPIPIPPVPELVAMAQKRLDTLKRGELRKRAEGEQSADPVEFEAWKLARATLTDAFKKSGELAEAPKGTKDRMLWVINKRRAANKKPAFADAADAFEEFYAKKSETAQKLWAEAERRVAEVAAIDLDELGIA